MVKKNSTSSSGVTTDPRAEPFSRPIAQLSISTYTKQASASVVATSRTEYQNKCETPTTSSAESDDWFIIVRYGELALKGDNRNVFEFKLLDNISDQLKRAGFSGKVERIRGRFFVKVADKDLKTSLDILTKVFGVVSVSPSRRVPSTVDDIVSVSEKMVSDFLSDKGVKKDFPFRVTTKRINKDFPKTSMDLDAYVGGKLLDKFPLKVSLSRPPLVVGIEIYKDTFVFTESFAGPGGLPVGVSGDVAVSIDGDFGLLSAYLVMKRGCSPFLFSKESVDGSALSSLQKYSPGLLDVKPLSGDVGLILETYSCLAFVDSGIGLPLPLSGVKDFVVLRPLVAFSEKDAKNLCERYCLDRV
jgi:adenylyl- and sulfurtransferase ThiI